MQCLRLHACPCAQRRSYTLNQCLSGETKYRIRETGMNEGGITGWKSDCQAQSPEKSEKQQGRVY